MEAIKSMLGDAFAEEKIRWPAPKNRPWLSILFLLHDVEEKAALRIISLSFKGSLINFLESDPSNNKSSLGEGKGQERRGEMDLPTHLNTYSSKCGPWTSYRHLLVAC